MMISATVSGAAQAPITNRTETAPSGGIPVSELKHLTATLPRHAPAMARAVPLVDFDAMGQALQDLNGQDFASNQPFAEVYKNGKVVARLDNGGGATTWGTADGIISGVNEPYSGGPELARWRAEKIAAALGGTVKIADTAQTQSQWEASYANERSLLDQAMAPYRAAMEAWRAQMDAWTADRSSETSTTA